MALGWNEIRENAIRFSKEWKDAKRRRCGLTKAHNALDKAVDKCYRSKPFESDAKRMEFLFELYEKYTAPLVGKKDQKSKA